MRIVEMTKRECRMTRFRNEAWPASSSAIPHSSALTRRDASSHASAVQFRREAMGMNDDVQKLRELLANFSTAMLITHTDEHHLRTVPMAIAKVDEDGTIWFVTGRESGKAHDIETNAAIEIVCMKEFTEYLSVHAHATLSRDMEKIDEVWDQRFRAWFPEGRTDPNLMLIRAQPVRAEFWDNSGWKGVQYKFREWKAAMTGTQPEVEEGTQHGVLNLKS